MGKRKKLKRNFRKKFAKDRGYTCEICGKKNLIHHNDVEKVLETEGLIEIIHDNIFGYETKSINYLGGGHKRNTELRGSIYHIDHIKPISKGGTNEKTNLQLTCEPCNLAKGGKYEE